MGPSPGPVGGGAAGPLTACPLMAEMPVILPPNAHCRLGKARCHLAGGLVVRF